MIQRLVRSCRGRTEPAGVSSVGAAGRAAWLVRLVSGAVLAALIAGQGHAHDLRHGDLHIGHAWTRPAPVGAAAEVYFPLINRGARDDRLTGARSSIATAAGLAETRGGAAEPLEAIVLPAGKPVALRPGRLHVRLEGLGRALEAGDQFIVTLLFAGSSPADVTVIVESAAGH